MKISSFILGIAALAASKAEASDRCRYKVSEIAQSFIHQLGEKCEFTIKQDFWTASNYTIKLKCETSGTISKRVQVWGESFRDGSFTCHFKHM